MKQVPPCQLLQIELLRFFDDRSQALAWCGSSETPSKLFQICLANGQRQWSLSPEQLDFKSPSMWTLHHQWTQTYKRQTSCPSDFAWLDLEAKPTKQKGVILEWGFEHVSPEWGGSNQPIAEDGNVLWLLPAMLKGLIDGLRQVNIHGLQLRIRGMRVHLVDSRPRSYYICAFQAMETLALALPKQPLQDKST